MSDGKNSEVKIKWYFKPGWIIIAILALGPLAIPVIIMSPALKNWHKFVLTALVIILTLWSIKMFAEMYSMFLKRMEELQAVLKP